MAGREPPTDAGVHSNQVNVLTGTLAKLGLARRAKALPNVRQYLEIKDAAA